jgi:hypothetical protein
MIPLFGSQDILPSELGDFSYNWIIENENPRLGFQVRYSRGASKADLFLYDAGFFPVPQDITDPIILSHFESCVEDIHILTNAELYNDFMSGPMDWLEVTSGRVKTKFLHWQFEYTVKDSNISVDIGLQRSHILLTSHKGYFSKIRYSYPADDRINRINDLYGLLKDWVLITESRL